MICNLMSKNTYVNEYSFLYYTNIAIMNKYETIKVHYDNPMEKAITIVFSREKQLNAMNSLMVKELSTLIDEIDSVKEKYRVLILTGGGAKSFVAGADISEMSNMSPNEAKLFLSSAQNALLKLEKLDLPVIAKINGFALGGGFELALACDIRIASQNALLGLPEVTLGIIPSAGGTQRLTKLVGESIAKYWILTAKRLKAKEAYDFGVVHEVCEPQDLDEYTNKLIEKIIGLAPIALVKAKKSIQSTFWENTIIGYEDELNNAVNCFESDDLREGMNAFLEKRRANFENK